MCVHLYIDTHWAGYVLGGRKVIVPQKEPKKHARTHTEREEEEEEKCV